jgi:hypothetical protein
MELGLTVLKRIGFVLIGEENQASCFEISSDSDINGLHASRIESL